MQQKNPVDEYVDMFGDTSKNRSGAQRRAADFAGVSSATISQSRKRGRLSASLAKAAFKKGMSAKKIISAL